MDTTEYKQDNPVTMLIENAYGTLSNSEKQVADYILKHPEETITMTMASLSKYAGVSEPTILRFCRKLNYNGYQEFKIFLAKGGSAAPEESLKIIHEAITPDDTIRDISGKVMNSHILALQETFASMDYGQMEKAAEIIMKSSGVDFFGLGGSGTVAVDVENKFIRTDVRTRVCIDAHIQLMWTSLSRRGHAIVIFSNSGVTSHFRKVMELAKKNKVKLILVTSATDTVLTRLADVVLTVRAREVTYKKEPSSARIAMLSLMDVIVTSIALRNPEHYIDNIYKTRKALKEEKE